MHSFTRSIYYRLEIKNEIHSPIKKFEMRYTHMVKWKNRQYIQFPIKPHKCRKYTVCPCLVSIETMQCLYCHVKERLENNEIIHLVMMKMFQNISHSNIPLHAYLALCGRSLGL